MFRYACLRDIQDKIDENGGGIDEFTQGYKYFGIKVQTDNSVLCREWAPGAKQLFLTGDFSKLLVRLAIYMSTKNAYF